MPDERCARCGHRVAWTSFWGNLSLTFYKVLIGVLGGSSALIADGFHSFTDVIGTSVILFSRRISGRPADGSHPYGHGKAEYLAAVFVYVVLVVLATALILGAIVVMRSGDVQAPQSITLLGAGISVFYNTIMYLLGQCAGRRNNSPALLANSFENRADAISSVAVMVGIVLAVTVHPVCDPLAALAVGVVILWNAITQLREASHGLMDKSLPDEVVRRIAGMAVAHAGVTGVDFVKSRRSGTHFWVDLGIGVSPSIGVAEADVIAREVRGDLMRRSERFGDVQVYVSPRRAAGDRKHT